MIVQHMQVEVPSDMVQEHLRCIGVTLFFSNELDEGSAGKNYELLVSTLSSETEWIAGRHWCLAYLLRDMIYLYILSVQCLHDCTMYFLRTGSTSKIEGTFIFSVLILLQRIKEKIKKYEHITILRV